MNWDIELAKMFKNNDNPSILGAIVGKVVSISPLKISILEGQAYLTKEHLYICESLLKDYMRDFIVEENNIVKLEGKIKYTTDLLEQGDEVLLISTADEQKFFIIDKVKKLG